MMRISGTRILSTEVFLGFSGSNLVCDVSETCNVENFRHLSRVEIGLSEIPSVNDSTKLIHHHCHYHNH